MSRDPFYDALFPEPSIEEAAGMFLRLKTAGHRPSEADDRLMADCVKVAAGNPAARLKLAFQQMKVADELGGDIGGPSIAPPSPPETPEADPYLAAEQEGMAVQEQQSADYYAARLREKAEEMGLLQEQLEQVTQENEAAQAELANVQQTIQTSQQEGQMAQQAALATSQQSNMALQTQMAQTQQAMVDATQAKLVVQEMRAKMLELAGQDPGIAGMGAPGMVPGAGQAMPGAPGAGAMPLNPEGATAPGAAPQDPAAAGGAPAPGGEQPAPAGGEAAPPAAEAPPTPAPPGGQAPGGESPSSKVQVKVGGALHRAGELLKGTRAKSLGNRVDELSGIESTWRGAHDGMADMAGKAKGLVQGAHQKEKLRVGATRAGVGAAAVGTAGAAAHQATKEAAHPALVGGLLGAAGGAGLAAMEAHGHGPDPEQHQQRIDELEQGSHQPGLKGFSQALELAKQRALQTLGTATREHPVAATLAGGAMGGMMGASAGPHIASGLREAASFYRR